MSSYIKVMFAYADTLFWDMKSNEELVSLNIQHILDQNILATYNQKFEEAYNAWINNDVPHSIIDIEQPFINNLIMHLKEVNTKGHNFYYWTDVDRTVQPNYVWTHCPLSGAKLADLGSSFAENNRLVSPAYPICFPR